MNQHILGEFSEMNTHVTPVVGEQFATPDWNQAYAWASALTGDPDNAVFNWRFIHDQDKGKPAIKRRGTLLQMWQEASQWNANGYGIFATVNEMDGFGDTLEHVAAIRAHVVDLDNLNAMQNLQRAEQHLIKPQFAVQTSPNKAHVYWVVTREAGPVDLDGYRLTQRKLRQLFDGDPAVIDAARVLRVPGFWHRKGAPHLVTVRQSTGYGAAMPAGFVAASVAHVNALDGGHSERHPLGDPALAAPSRDALHRALALSDPNDMDRAAWIAFTAGWKQAASTVMAPDEAKGAWLLWCQNYANNDPAENVKQWDSITETQLGWKSLLRHLPQLNAEFMFGGGQFNPGNLPTTGTSHPSAIDTWDAGKHPLQNQYGAILTAEECREWFSGCAFISSTGEMFTPFGMMKQTAFNAKYGGKRFIIGNTGAPTDEAWKAATRSVFWTVPKIDRLRFNPNERFGEIKQDELGRMSLNIYRPANVETLDGDPGPFLHHLSLVMPDEKDRKIFLDYLAHNVKFPGYKIPWAPLIQSVEGIGKGAFKQVMQHAMGQSYTYFPNAKLLNDSGSKFNAWMAQKLFFVADEIRTDEKRDMVETLKPFISETEIEIQGKGVNQVQSDNYANWLFFSNHKDAIPITDNSRRFAIFYSPIQSLKDLEARQMNDHYFRWLFDWLGAETHRNGLKIVAHYLLNYPIERGAIPMRAPHTSSHAEAVSVSLGPIASAIKDAIEAERPGFRGGWINRNLARDLLKRDYSSQKIAEAIREDLGGYKVGRHSTPIFQEGGIKPELFRIGEWRSKHHYMADQGYPC